MLQGATEVGRGASGRKGNMVSSRPPNPFLQEDLNPSAKVEKKGGINEAISRFVTEILGCWSCEGWVSFCDVQPILQICAFSTFVFCTKNGYFFVLFFAKKVQNASPT